MIIGGKAVVVPGKNVDTDVLYPGSYLNIDDPDLMKPYLFEGLDPSLRDQLVGDTVLIVGENFGMGSSREHVPLAMKAWGVRCVLGHSFARIFNRNCINLGLAVVSCPEAATAAKAGSWIEIDTDNGLVSVDGRSFQAAPIPGFMLDMLSQGGLIPWAQARVARAR
ncbi:MAG: LeuD/DmdB family oxidoreductase small subunit [Gaiellaceae bacterium]